MRSGGALITLPTTPKEVLLISPRLFKTGVRPA